MAVYVENLLPSAVSLKEKGYNVHPGEIPEGNCARILILNLMKNVEATEIQYMKKLCNYDIDVQLIFLHTATYAYKSVDPEHYRKYYFTFSDVKDGKYDAIVSTGAPLDYVTCLDTAFWDEWCQILDWARTNVKHSLHTCWGAFGFMYHCFNIDRIYYEKKGTGVFKNYIKMDSPLVEGLSNPFEAPHSRYVGILASEADAADGIHIIADTEEVGPALLMTDDGKDLISFCHFDYEGKTLHDEYFRDLVALDNAPMPANYFIDDNPNLGYRTDWVDNSKRFFGNWLRWIVSD